VSGLGKLKEARTFNIEKIDRLYNGDAVKINDLLKMIHTQIKDDLEMLQDNVKEKDQESVSFLVHKMKSTIDLIGNDNLLHKIGLLENSFGENSSDDEIQTKAVDDVTECLNDLVAELQCLLVKA